MRNDAEITHKSVTKYDNDDMNVKDCEDDGESAAGGRMLHLLEILDVKNILVIVSRYIFTWRRWGDMTNFPKFRSFNFL